MQVYDLSVPVKNGADWYNEEITPPVEIWDVGSLETDGWVSHMLKIQVINGTTYLETAGHIYKDGATLDQIPADKLICRAFIVRLPGKAKELPAPAETISDFRGGEDALLLYCGWDTHWDQPDFYSASPYFSDALQQWILDHNPFILGGDMTSFDHPQAERMTFVPAFFGMGGMILCPLIGLGDIPRDQVTLCAAPMKLVGVNAAPCRAFAWVLQPPNHR